MRPILAGIETEYGFSIPGRGPETQFDDAARFVASCPVRSFAGWDYRFESPRRDLRGFSVDSLQYDKRDAEYDSGAYRFGDPASRADRVLPNGARFYNDHGHPEYATPECWSVADLVLADLAGERLMAMTADQFLQENGQDADLFKNNVDYSGAAYGTHESYHVPRHHGFEAIYRAVTPILVARTLLCGAGTVIGDRSAEFLISARAPHLEAEANIETLSNRPVFNTRDEPHAPDAEHIRLHVICGDANRNPSSTAMKVAFVKVALWLLDAGKVPDIELKDAVVAFRNFSRGFEGDKPGKGTGLAVEILERYIDAFHKLNSREGCSDESAIEAIELSERLLANLSSGSGSLVSHVDWAAKRYLFDQFGSQAKLDVSVMQSLDLAYHALDPAQSLFTALIEAGNIAPTPDDSLLEQSLHSQSAGSRADLRGWLVENHLERIDSLTWSSATVKDGDRSRTIELPVDYRSTPAQMASLSWETFVGTRE